MIDFKNVLLSEIRPDPNQPRKYYDETAMQELTDSVREKGILQPILIRPNGKGYIIVCGERRYRAAMAVQIAIKDRKEIPAVIRELSDDEALELQIIENLQRKDVHPMEEAVAFKSLLEKGKSAEEVAARVGKSVFYVRQRMKLNSLTKEWQKVFYNGQLNNTEAMKLGLFDDKIQGQLFTQFSGRSGSITFDDWALRSYRGNLHDASFDTADPAIDKKMGACTGCQFNSATANLFPDSHATAKCSNITCFKNKSDINFNKSFLEAIADPTMTFVHAEYGNNVGDKFVTKAIKEGHNVLNRNSYDTNEKPRLVDFDDWKERQYDEDDVRTDKQLRTAYEKDEVSEYKNELKDYETSISGGKYKKAFMLTGNDRGRFVYISVRKSTTASSGSSKRTKEKEAAGRLTVADIDEEIKRIQDRQKRLTELDMEKVQVNILTELEKKPELKQSAFVSQMERGIMIFLLLEHAGDYRTHEFLGKHLKSIPARPHTHYKWHDDYFKTLAGISEGDLSLLVRHLAFAKYGNKNTISGIRPGDTAMRLMADYLKVNIRVLELEQEEIATKRKEKADKRIAALKEQKKALVKPVAKKSSKQDLGNKPALDATEFVKARAEKKPATPVPTKKARASRHTAK